MSENENLSFAMEKIEEMLNSKDGREQISEILNMLSGDNKEQNKEQNKNTENPFSGFDIGMLQGILSDNNVSGKNEMLLKSLMPFLKKERREKLSSAVKLLNAVTVAKNLGFFKKGGD